MQRAGLDQQEIGDQRAHLGDVLDPADEVAVRGIELLHDRRSGGRPIAVGDHDVDHVAAEAGVVGGIQRPLDDGVLLLAGAEKEGDVVDQVAAGGAHVVASRGHVGEGGQQIAERLVDGMLGDVLVELAQLGAPVLVGLGQALQDHGQLLLQRLDLGLHVLAHGLGKRIEDLGLDDLALVHGGHGEAGRRAQDGDVLGLRLGVQRLQRLLLARPELLVDGAAANLIVLAFEARRQDAPELVERRHHAPGERLAAPVRKLQRLRPVGVFEVVDVDPVGRRGCLGGLGSQVGLDGGGLARGRRAQHEDVEVVALDVGAELDGFQRPILADQPGDRNQLVRGLEGERRRVDDAAQLGGLERLRTAGDGRHLSFGVGRGIVIRCTLEKRHDPPGCCAGRDNRRRPRRRKGRRRQFLNAFREVTGRNGSIDQSCGPCFSCSGLPRALA